MGNGCTSNKAVATDDSKSMNFKVVVVGNNYCGKSSLLRRFIQNEFVEEYFQTLSPDITSAVRKVNVPNHALVSLELWDIPGQDNLDLRKTYYRDVDAVIVVVDLSVDNSLELAPLWKLDVLNHAKITRHFNEIVVTDDNKRTKVVKRTEYISPKQGQIPILLVGNKYDLAKANYLAEVENNNEMITKSVENLNESEDAKMVINRDFGATEVGDENIVQNIDKSTEIEEDKTVLPEETHQKKKSDEHTNGEKTDRKEPEIDSQTSTDSNGTTTFHISNNISLENSETKKLENENSITQNEEENQEISENGNHLNHDHSTEVISNKNGHVQQHNGGMKKIFPKDLKKSDPLIENCENNNISSEVEANIPSATSLLPACVEELERVASKHGFISGIPVSCKTTNGGVHEAVQSLMRHLVVKRTFNIETNNKRQRNTNQADSLSMRTMRSVTSQSTATMRRTYQNGFEPLQNVGISEVDKTIVACNQPLQKAEDAMAEYFTALHTFKQLCKKHEFVRSSRCSLEECFSSFKNAVSYSVHGNASDVIMKMKQNDNNNEGLILIAEKPNVEFLTIRIVDGNHDNAEKVMDQVSGELVDNPLIHENVKALLDEYRTKFQPKASVVLTQGHELEKILSHNEKLLAGKEDKAWEVAVASGLSHQEVRLVMMVLAQNKARVRGTLENIREALKSVGVNERKIRASLLF